MKQINNYILEHFENSNFSIVERLHINKDIGKQNNHYNYHPKTNGELIKIVDKLIKERGNNADLNDIDTSEITDMDGIFEGSNFNGDISNWDVSNVENMKFMFYNSEFNGDLSKWNVSNVKDMMSMFYASEFTAENGDIYEWDVRNVQIMFSMFTGTPLEKNPHEWYKE